MFFNKNNKDKNKINYIIWYKLIEYEYKIKKYI